jgi:putative ABC transport system permease protein
MDNSYRLLEILIGIFVAVYGALALMVLHRPLIGRLALREVVRRKGQTAILVIGLMVAGASIFAVQVFTDSATQSFTNYDLATWGRDDIEISAGGAAFDHTLALRLASDAAVAKDSAAIQNAFTLTTSVTDLDRNLGKPGVQLTGLDLVSQHRFGSFVLADGRKTEGGELTLGRVFLTQPLADALGARAGDRLQVTIPVGAGPAELVVAGVVQRTEAGAYGAYRSIFGSLETVQQLAGTSDVNLVRISAIGDGSAEVDRGTHLVGAIKTVSGGGGLMVLETKRAALRADITMASSLRAAFTSLSLVVALAASAMVVNLAVMLAEERRPRLAVLRALGLSRSGLVKFALVEGAIYSLAGAIAGLPLGIAVGISLNSDLQLGLNPGQAAIPLAVAPTSLIGSVVAASLITLTTLFFTSLRTSRMAISAAIRDLPEPPRTRRTSWVRIGLLSACALIGIGMILGGEPTLRLIGGAAVIASVGGLARGRLADRVRFTGIGAGIAAWAIGYVTLNVNSWGTNNQVPAAIMGLCVAVIGASIFAAANLRLLERAVGLPGSFAANLRVTLRPALAYTSRRPLRSGLVIGAFALIVAILTSLSASVSNGRPDYARASGGYDVRVTEVGSSQLTLPSDVQRNVSKMETLPSRTFLGPVKTFNDGGLGSSSDWHVQPITVFGLTDEQLMLGIVPLVSWDTKYHSAAEAWKAIANDPGLVAGPFLTGTRISIATVKGTLELRVAALVGGLSVGGNVVDGLMASNRVFDWLTASPAGIMLLLKAAPGVPPRALSDQVQRATLSLGADATTTRQILDDSYAAGQGFLDLLLALVRVGLLVGVFSLGTIALRAVVERRRAIGVLRAIGFAPRQVLLGMVVETLLTATAGVVVGIGCAYAIGSATLVGGDITAAFVPDAETLWTAIALVYLAVLLVTVLPALRASRLRPAEALRTVA